MELLVMIYLTVFLDGISVAMPPPGTSLWEWGLYILITAGGTKLFDYVLEMRKKSPKEKLAEAKEILKEMQEFKDLLDESTHEEK